MSNRFYIILLVLLGFFMNPSVAIACGTKPEKTCCEKNSLSIKDKKECCKKKQSSNEQSHEGCDGSCKNLTCSASTVYSGMTSSLYPEVNNLVFSFYIEKQNHYYSEIFISSTFSSIWLPPKIG